MLKLLKPFNAELASSQTAKARKNAVNHFYSEILAVIDRRSKLGHNFAVYEFPIWFRTHHFESDRAALLAAIKELGFECELYTIDSKLRFQIYW
jgi:hypothetical protein